MLTTIPPGEEKNGSRGKRKEERKMIFSSWLPFGLLEKDQIRQILAVLKLLVKNIMIWPFFDAEENGTFLAKSEQIL